MKLEKILHAGKNILTASLLSSLLFFGCKKEDSKPDSGTNSDQIVLASNTKVLTDQNLNEATNYDWNSITFNDSPNSPNLKIGDIIVGGISEKTPDGILAKVTNVYNNGHSAQLTNASLSDAITSGKIDFTKTFTMQDTKSLLTKSSNINYNFEYDFDKVLYDLDGNENTTNDQIRESGKMYFNVDMGLHFDFTKKTINFSTNLETLARMELDAELTQHNFNKDTILAYFPFKPITFFLPTSPPFPVVIIPIIDISAGTNGEVNAESRVTVEQTNSFNLEINYDNGWSSSKNFSSNFTYETPQATFDASVNNYLSLDGQLKLYGVMGPYLNVIPSLDLEINTSNNPWLDLYGKIKATLGLDKTILGIGNNCNFDLVDYQKTLLELTKPPVGNTITDSRDGHVYKIVQIGNQNWFAENLAYNSPNSHYYNDDPNNSAYGKLYNWNIARNACPSGWHLPSDEEFKTLEKYLGMSSTEADQMAPDRGSNENVGTKLKFGGSSEFDALMAGEMTSTGTSMNLGSNGYFWTSKADASGAYNRILYSTNTGVSRDNYIIPEAYFSVRCLKDGK